MQEYQTIEVIDEGETLPAPRRRNTILIISGVLVLALLAGAAFVAGRLLQNEASPLSPDGFLTGPGGEGGMDQSIGIEVIPPEELPDRDADIVGNFLRRDDNSIFVSQIVEGMGGAGGGAVAAEPAAGPEIEIVITEDTTIYRDATEFLPPGELAEGQTIQQHAEQVDDINEIGPNTFIMVWGKRTGDRVVAEIAFYVNPIVMQIDPDTSAP